MLCSNEGKLRIHSQVCSETVHKGSNSDRREIMPAGIVEKIRKEEGSLGTVNNRKNAIDYCPIEFSKLFLTIESKIIPLPDGLSMDVDAMIRCLRLGVVRGEASSPHCVLT